jgi:hypothetical protein
MNRPVSKPAVYIYRPTFQSAEAAQQPAQPKLVPGLELHVLHWSSVMWGTVHGNQLSIIVELPLRFIRWFSPRRLARLSITCGRLTGQLRARRVSVLAPSSRQILPLSMRQGKLEWVRGKKKRPGPGGAVARQCLKDDPRPLYTLFPSLSDPHRSVSWPSILRLSSPSFSLDLVSSHSSSPLLRHGLTADRLLIPVWSSVVLCT